MNISATEGRQKYYGIYTGTVIESLDNGDVRVTVDGVAQEPTIAKIVDMAGGTDSLDGIRSRPVDGARCKIMYEQGNVRAPRIIGYQNSQRAGIIGDLKQGEMMARSAGGALMQLGNDSNLRFVNREGRGLDISQNELSLKGKGFELRSSPVYARMRMPGAVHFYGSGQAILQNLNVREYFNDLTTFSENRKDEVSGNWELNSKNNIINRSSQFNVVASEEINFTARNDTAFMTDTFSVTSSTDQFFGSVLGNIDIATLAGDVTIAAGAVATADTGITTHTAQITLELLGNIEIDNLTCNTTYDLTGSISERALLGRENQYGPTGLSTTSVGNVAFDTSLSFTVNALLNIEMKATVDISIESVVNTSVTAGVNMDLTAGAIRNDFIGATYNLTTPGIMNQTTNLLNLISPLINMRITVPVQGVRVLTLLGPQYIIPFA